MNWISVNDFCPQAQEGKDHSRDVLIVDESGELFIATFFPKSNCWLDSDVENSADPNQQKITHWMDLPIHPSKRKSKNWHNIENWRNHLPLEEGRKCSWISVQKALPEDNKSVLVCGKYFHECAGMCYRIFSCRFYRTMGWMIPFAPPDVEVTHWSEIPQNLSEIPFEK